MLSKKEKEIIKYFSAKDIDIAPRPFKSAAMELGTSEDEVVQVIEKLKARGVVKKMRGVIDHREAGYRRNALIAWRVKKEDVVRKVFLKDDRISHCYLRVPHKDFDFNLFTMMHARTKKEIEDFVNRTAGIFKIDNEILFTKRELKKKRLALGEILS